MTRRVTDLVTRRVIRYRTGYTATYERRMVRKYTISRSGVTDMSQSLLSKFELSEERLAQLQEEVRKKRQQAREQSQQLWRSVEVRSADVTGRLRDDSLTTVYEAGANALSKAADWLDQVPLARDGAEGLRQRSADLEEARQSIEQPPVDDYDEMNVREVDEALDGLTVCQLQKVRRYEEANKDRVTVLRSIERRLS